jgi:hypothetical protein
VGRPEPPDPDSLLAAVFRIGPPFSYEMHGNVFQTVLAKYCRCWPLLWWTHVTHRLPGKKIVFIVSHILLESKQN